MNEIRHISAKSQHNFHFLAEFNSNTSEPIFTIFLHDEYQLVELLMHTSARRWCVSFQITQPYGDCTKCYNKRYLTVLYTILGMCIVPGEPYGTGH